MLKYICPSTILYFNYFEEELSLNQKLHYVKVTPENISLALQIQGIVWPKNPVDHDYRLKANGADEANASWLVYRHEGSSDPSELVGLTGLYTYDPDEVGYDNGESVWMDWFGVLPRYRGHGFGEQILRRTICYASQLDRFKYFRLDTSDFDGRISTKLYDKVMHLREDYTAETYPEGYRGLIYSYSLGNFPVKPWENRLLDLKLYGALESIIV